MFAYCLLCYLFVAAYFVACRGAYAKMEWIPFCVATSLCLLFAPILAPVCMLTSLACVREFTEQEIAKNKETVEAAKPAE